MPSATTLDDAIAAAASLLAPLGAEALREAQALAAARLGIGRAALLLRGPAPVDADVAAGLLEWARRRAAGEPHAYIVGWREFWTLRLAVTPAVLVPRPETELLVERALALGDAARALAVVDLGTGSGAVALAIASERPGWHVTATDASEAALAVARGNALAAGLQRVEFVAGRWYVPLGGRRFDLIVSNPPYIAGDDPVLQGDSLSHEPLAALTPGPDALAALREIVRGAPAQLAPGGALLLEHGADQGPVVRALLVAEGFAHVRSHRDLAGHERVTEGRRR